MEMDLDNMMAVIDEEKETEKQRKNKEKKKKRPERESGMHFVVTPPTGL